MLKHTAVVRPSGWRRKASKERCFMAGLFDKTNFILLAVGMAVVILGFILMTGPVSTPTHFEPDIFSVRRIKVAPLVCLLGFVFMIYAVLRKPKTEDKTEE